MDAQELLDEWESEGDETNGLRPQRIQQLRDALREHTDQYVPRRVPEIESWLDAKRPQITRALRDAAGVYDDESDGE